ncbi:MAG: hypothetical protein QMC80_04745 [Thermoplasmatales archaeon]|nr:hypothetical protein [Thermoplasmatales archaeon]
MNRKLIGIIIILIIIAIAGFSITSIKTEKQKKAENYITGVDLTYLDDTEISEDVYAVNICGPRDCGIILINNTGEKEDSFSFSADAPDGFSISFEYDIMQVNTEGIQWNTIYYETSSPLGSYFANVTATSVSNPDAKDTLTLRLDVTKTMVLQPKKVTR